MTIEELVVKDPTFSESSFIAKVDNTFINQVKPNGKKSMKKILDLINVNEEEKFLIQIFIISLFIPDIQKVSLVLTSPTGTGKSTITDIIKTIVDPSQNKKSKTPKSLNDLERVLSLSYLPCFDNIDNISTEQSNVLCRAITGGTYIRYKGDKTIVSSYTRPIILNGIKCPIYKEDLIDRMLIIEPPIINNTLIRKNIDEILEEELPNVLAYIFDILSKARITIDELNLDNDRMAEWYNWAYAIAEAIEYGSGWKFENIYNKNKCKKNKVIISNNSSAMVLLDYVKNGGLFIGEPKEMTSTELFNILSSIAKEKGYAFNYKSGVEWLIRNLNSIANILQKEGVIFKTDHRGNANYVILTRIPPKE